MLLQLLRLSMKILRCWNRRSSDILPKGFQTNQVIVVVVQLAQKCYLPDVDKAVNAGPYFLFSNDLLGHNSFEVIFFSKKVPSIQTTS